MAWKLLSTSKFALDCNATSSPTWKALKDVMQKVMRRGRRGSALLSSEKM